MMVSQRVSVSLIDSFIDISMKRIFQMQSPLCQPSGPFFSPPHSQSENTSQEEDINRQKSLFMAARACDTLLLMDLRR